MTEKLIHLDRLLGHNAQLALQKETIPAAKNTLNILQRVFRLTLRLGYASVQRSAQQ